MKKLGVLLLVVCMLATIPMTAGMAEGVTVSKEGYPIVSEPITLRIMCAKSPSFENSYADMEFWQEYEKLTNIHIEWEEVLEEAWDEKVSLVLASGSNLPDAFYSGNPGIKDATVSKYAAQGLIIPLNDLLKDYAPNANRVMEERPDARKMMTNMDGNIYGIATVDEITPMTTPNLMYINKTWLDRVGMDFPTNAEEYYQCLKAFKEKDGNGNGVIGDEICLTAIQFSSANQVSMQLSLTNLFGLFDVIDDNSHVQIVDNVVQFSPIQPGYREALEWFHKLYSEGLLDMETFTQNEAQYQAKVTSPEGVGATINLLPTGLGNGEYNEYKILEPMKMANGETQPVMQLFIIPNYRANGFCITKDCKYPEAAMRWIDTFLDNDENALTIRFGKEGETWAWLADDHSQFTENATTPSGEVVDTGEISKYTPAYKAVMWLFRSTNSKKVGTIPTSIYASGMVKNYYIPQGRLVWPNGLSLSNEALEELSSYDMDLRQYTDNMLTQFIMNGVTDAEWDAYVKQCKALGCDEVTALYQARWDLYQAG